jgi:hypothetical protein
MTFLYLIFSHPLFRFSICKYIGQISGMKLNHLRIPSYDEIEDSTKTFGLDEETECLTDGMAVSSTLSATKSASPSSAKAQPNSSSQADPPSAEPTSANSTRSATPERKSAPESTRKSPLEFQLAIVPGNAKHCVSLIEKAQTHICRAHELLRHAGCDWEELYRLQELMKETLIQSRKPGTPVATPFRVHREVSLSQSISNGKRRARSPSHESTSAKQHPSSEKRICQELYNPTIKGERIAFESQSLPSSRQLSPNLVEVKRNVTNVAQPSVEVASASPAASSSANMRSTSPFPPQMVLTNATQRIVSRTRTARTIWTDEEEQSLEEAMREFGTHWSDIISMYGEEGRINQSLARFSQMQLKDKARNIRSRRERDGIPLGAFALATRYPVGEFGR